MPQHRWAAQFHADWSARFKFQKGQVLHCVGRARYIRHSRLFWSFCRKVQSPLAFSVKLIRHPTRRLCLARSSVSLIFKNSAISRSSGLLTQTYPGAPPQHLPHCWQTKCSPSAYHFLLTVHLLFESPRPTCRGSLFTSSTLDVQQPLR